MYKFPIGIIIDGLKVDRSTAIRTAAEMGVDGIQMFATKGESSPEKMDSGARKALKALEII